MPLETTRGKTEEVKHMNVLGSIEIPECLLERGSCARVLENACQKICHLCQMCHLALFSTAKIQKRQDKKHNRLVH